MLTSHVVLALYPSIEKFQLKTNIIICTILHEIFIACNLLYHLLHVGHMTVMWSRACTDLYVFVFNEVDHGIYRFIVERGKVTKELCDESRS